MKPGHGEVLIAEGDVEVPEETTSSSRRSARQLDAGMWAAVPTADRGGRRQAQMVSSFDDVPRDAERVIFFPRAAGGAEPGERRPCCSRSAPASSSIARAALGGRAGRARREDSRAGARAARCVEVEGYDPGRERRAEQRARDAAALVRQRGGVGDVPRPRLHPGLGRRSPRARSADRDVARRAVRLPDLPAQADRRLPAADPPAAQRVLRRRSPTRRAPTARRACRTPTTCSPSGWR